MGFIVIILVFYLLIGFSSPGSEGGLCPPAHYCPKGSVGPVPCPAGTYTNLTGQSVCSRCLAGYYCTERTENFTQFPCPPGFYCPDGIVDPILPVIVVFKVAEKYGNLEHSLLAANSDTIKKLWSTIAIQLLLCN